MANSYTPVEVEKNFQKCFQDNEIGTLVYRIWNNIALAHLAWREYRNLFHYSPERRELLLWSSRTFFIYMEKAVRNDVLLRLSRLLDPATMRKNENISLELLLNCLPMTNQHHNEDTFREMYNEINQSSRPLKRYRDKYIAHDDIKNIDPNRIDYQSDSLFKLVDNLLEMIATLFNAIERHYCSSSTDFRDYPIPDGSDALIALLEKARSE